MLWVARHGVVEQIVEREFWTRSHAALLSTSLAMASTDPKFSSSNSSSSTTISKVSSRNTTSSTVCSDVITPLSMSGSSFVTSRPPVTFSWSHPRMAAFASPLLATMLASLSEPETCFAVAERKRPVDEVARRLAQAGICELGKQLVASSPTVEEAQTPQIGRPRRSGRLHEAVPYYLNAHPPEGTYRRAEQGPHDVLTPRKRRQVEDVAVLTVKGGFEHSVAEHPPSRSHPKHRYRCLGGTWTITPAQERRILLGRAGHYRSDPLEQVVEGIIESVERLDFEISTEAAVQCLIYGPQSPVQQPLQRARDRRARARGRRRDVLLHLVRFGAGPVGEPSGRRELLRKLEEPPERRRDGGHG